MPHFNNGEVGGRGTSGSGRSASISISLPEEQAKKAVAAAKSKGLSLFRQVKENAAMLKNDFAPRQQKNVEEDNFASEQRSTAAALRTDSGSTNFLGTVERLAKAVNTKSILRPNCSFGVPLEALFLRERSDTPMLMSTLIGFIERRGSAYKMSSLLLQKTDPMLMNVIFLKKLSGSKNLKVF